VSVSEREADVLMGLLPSHDWDGFVRRGELEHVASTLRLEMQAMESRLTASFHRDTVRQTWILAGTLLAGLGTLGGLLH
jgi:phytoene dehydrogenase-like protein